MNIISLIASFFKYLPTLIETVRMVLGEIQKIQDSIERAKKAKELKEAAKLARETKDTSKLEDAFGIKTKVLALPGGVDIELRRSAQGLIGGDSKEESPVDLSLGVKNVLMPESGETPILKQEMDGSVKKKSLVVSFTKAVGFGISSKSTKVIAEPQQELSMMSFGSGQMGGIINDTDPEVFNVSYLGNGPRMQARLLGSIALLALVVFTGCNKDDLPQNMPSYKPKIWAGDSESSGIRRAQSGEFIHASDPKFDDYVALHQDTLGCIVETYVNNCIAYKQQVVKCTKLTPEQKKEARKILLN